MAQFWFQLRSVIDRVRRYDCQREIERRCSWGPKVGFKVLVEGIFSERRDNTVYAASDARCAPATIMHHHTNGEH